MLLILYTKCFCAAFFRITIQDLIIQPVCTQSALILTNSNKMLWNLNLVCGLLNTPGSHRRIQVLSVHGKYYFHIKNFLNMVL